MTISMVMIGKTLFTAVMGDDTIDWPARQDTLRAPATIDNRRFRQRAGSGSGSSAGDKRYGEAGDDTIYGSKGMTV